DHQHPAALPEADVLVVEVHADDGVGAQRPGGLEHLRDRGVLGLPQALLVERAAPADHVADAGHEVTEDVGPEDRLAGDETRYSRTGRPSTMEVVVTSTPRA